MINENVRLLLLVIKHNGCYTFIITTAIPSFKSLKLLGSTYLLTSKIVQNTFEFQCIILNVIDRFRLCE